MKKALLLLNMVILTASGFSENLYLLSFPRSGSCWTMYFIQFLTKQPWNSGFGKRTFSGLENIVDLQLPSNYRGHGSTGKNINKSPSRIFRQYEEGDKLIFLLRNYRECMLRHFEYNMTKICYLIQMKKNVFEELLQFNQDI